MKHLTKNQKVFISLITVTILILVFNSPKKGMVVSMETCFEDKDCIVPIQEGYCDVKYMCYIGRCYSEQVPCPEICYDGIDNSLNGLIDCDDPECFDSVYCPCTIMRYEHCYPGRCYCPEGYGPKWALFEDGDSRCICW